MVNDDGVGNFPSLYDSARIEMIYMINYGTRANWYGKMVGQTDGSQFGDKNIERKKNIY